MRKLLCISAAVLLFGCSKEINNVSVNTASTSEIKNAASNTYLPLTKGTYWNYKIKMDDESPDSSKLTVLGIQKKINGKNYQTVKSVRDNSIDTLYYTQDGHNYYIYTNNGMSDGDNVNMEILFLKDNAHAGTTWNVASGSANGFKLKCFGKIIETNATVKVGDTTYTHVIHSYVEIRKPLLFTYVTVDKQDFYTAQNVGIIKNISTVLLPKSSTTTTGITGYKIK